MTQKEYKNHVPSYLRALLHQDLRIVKDKVVKVKDKTISQQDKQCIDMQLGKIGNSISKYINTKYRKAENENDWTPPTSKQVSNEIQPTSTC